MFSQNKKKSLKLKEYSFKNISPHCANMVLDLDSRSHLYFLKVRLASNTVLQQE